MQIKSFFLNAANAERSEAEVNLFLRSHRILRIDRSYNEALNGWAIIVEYQDEQPDAVSPVARRGGKKDYTKDLTEEQKGRYDRLREKRTLLARENNVPAYLIFTNEELSILAREEELSAENSKKITGIAPSRLRDNLELLLGVQLDNEEKETDEASGTSD